MLTPNRQFSASKRLGAFCRKVGTWADRPRLASEQFRFAQGPIVSSVVPSVRGKPAALAPATILASAHMKRREFITLIGGAAAAWPLAARAQQPGRARRIGVLMASPVTDARYQSLVACSGKGLQELGWDERSNIQIDYRWAAEDAESIRAYARELVGLRPDVIYVMNSSSTSKPRRRSASRCRRRCSPAPTR
jgi:hypothetical protein